MEHRERYDIPFPNRETSEMVRTALRSAGQGINETWSKDDWTYQIGFFMNPDKFRAFCADVGPNLTQAIEVISDRRSDNFRACNGVRDLAELAMFSGDKYRQVSDLPNWWPQEKTERIR